MKINEPLTPEQHADSDEQYKRTAINQKQFMEEIAALLENGTPLNSLQAKFAAAVLRGAAKGMSLQRPRPAGRPSKVPEEAIVLRTVYIKGGMRPTDADNKLAEAYDVDLDTFREAIKRLKKTDILKEWGLE